MGRFIFEIPIPHTFLINTLLACWRSLLGNRIGVIIATLRNALRAFAVCLPVLLLLIGASSASANHGGDHPSASAFGFAPGGISVNWQPTEAGGADLPIIDYFTVHRETPSAYWVVARDQINYP